MEIIKIILLIILVALMVLCLYSVSNTNKKLKRLRRRYDFLLRGRGELNLEELIVKYGEELDEQIARQKQVDDRIVNFKNRLEQAEGTQASLVDERNAKMQDQFSAEFNNLSQSLTSSMKRLDERVYARMDEVDNNSKNQLNASLKKVEKNVENFSKQLSSQIKKQEEDNFVQFDSVKKEMQENKQEINKKVDRNQEKAKQDIQEVNASLTKTLNQEVLSIRDQLAITVQKVHLYRYNAFDDLTGEQSFTCVFLDENRDGVLITSIYSRRGSSIFAKTIDQGESRQSLSPEERIALENALDK